MDTRVTQTANHYAEHLAEINQQYSATTAENIYNDQGALVIPRGQAVTRDVARRIAQHKLVKPLEESVSLGRTMTPQMALEHLNEHIEAVGLSSMFESLAVRDEVVNLLSGLSQYPLVLQKLTVMQERLPHLFRTSLTCAVASLAICRRLKLEPNTIANVFIASLIKDSGLLHIDPELVNKKGAYSAEEWRMVQGHVVISAHFASLVPGLSKCVSRAVLEHHERIDGFGYPKGKRGNQLCLEGQVVSLVDTISALFRKHVLSGGVCHSLLVPILQVNSSAFDIKLLNASICILRGVKYTYRRAYTDEEIPQLLSRLREQQARLNGWFDQIKSLQQQFGTDLEIIGTDSKSLLLLEKIAQMVVTSGMLSEYQADWLGRVSQQLDSKDFEAVELCAVILSELEYQCNTVMRNFEQEYRKVSDKLLNPQEFDKRHAELKELLKAA